MSSHSISISISISGRLDPWEYIVMLENGGLIECHHRSAMYDADADAATDADADAWCV